MPFVEAAEILSPLDVLAFEFFREFARCEYCLKGVGFRTIGDSNPGPDWSAFSREVEDIFERPSEQMKATIQYFLDFPPKKQVVQDGILSWDAAPPPDGNLSELILVLIRRVRNNLFHGGKFNGHWFEPQRSEDLLRPSLAILRIAIHANPRTHEAYEHQPR